VWTTLDWSGSETSSVSVVPVLDMRSLPRVGVEAALREVTEEMEDELSARARGAKGGGLPDTGGLKGRAWRGGVTPQGVNHHHHHHHHHRQDSNEDVGLIQNKMWRQHYDLCHKCTFTHFILIHILQLL